MGIPAATCGECGKLAFPVKGDVIYPHRPDLHNRRYFRCTCGAYCGAHLSTGHPLGRPAGTHTRTARRFAHEAFDRIWQGGLMSRNAAYVWLSGELGIDEFFCHIGSFDRATADRVTRICRDYWSELDPAKAKAAQAYQAEGRYAAKPKGKKPRCKGGKAPLPHLRKETRHGSSRNRVRGPYGEGEPFA